MVNKISFHVERDFINENVKQKWTLFTKLRLNRMKKMYRVYEGKKEIEGGRRSYSTWKSRKGKEETLANKPSQSNSPILLVLLLFLKLSPCQ